MWTTSGTTYTASINCTLNGQNLTFTLTGQKGGGYEGATLGTQPTLTAYDAFSVSFGGSVTRTLSAKAATYYIYSPGGTAVLFVWTGSQAKNNVVCDLKIKNETGAVNPDGWVEVNGVRYGPAPVGGLSETVDLGWLTPGTVIPITYGSGVSGGTSSYTVPDSPGAQVTFSVNAVTGGGEGKNIVTGSITEFKDGKWFAKVKAKNVDRNINVHFYQVGWISTTLQIVNEGEFVMELTPTSLEQDYELLLRDITNGVDLDRRAVPYAPLKVTVIANLKITNPGGVTAADSYVSINGVRREPGSGSLVEPYQLGEFEPGESIPVLFGAGITGGNFIYTVPNKRGEVVSFDVVGVVKDNGEPPTDPTDPTNPTDPVIPPQEPPVNPGDPGTDSDREGVEGKIDGVRDAVRDEGQKIREVNAEGFNKVLDSLYSSRVEENANFNRVVNAINNNSAVTGEGLDQIHKDLTEVPGESSMPSKFPVANTDGAREALNSLNPLGKIVIPETSAPVFDLTLDIGVVQPIDLHWDLGEEPWSTFAAWVRRLLLCFLFIFGSYSLIRVVSKGVSSI